MKNFIEKVLKINILYYREFKRENSQQNNNIH